MEESREDLEKKVTSLKLQNNVLMQGLVEACRNLYTMGFCINGGLCKDLNGNCLKCLYSKFVDKGLEKVFNESKSEAKKRV